MAKVITSKNQRGGITAETVNIGQRSGGSDPVQERRHRWRWISVAAAIATIIGVIVSVITFGVEYFSHSEGTEVGDEERQNFNVTSINQRGGITAGQVNLNAPQGRTLDEGNKNFLLQEIGKRPNAKISVVASLGDGEGAAFAQEIIEFLRSEGHMVDGLILAVSVPPIYGQSIDPSEEQIKIRIGHRKSSTGVKTGNSDEAAR